VEQKPNSRRSRNSYQVHPFILYLPDREHAKAGGVEQAELRNAKFGYRPSLMAKSVEARSKVFTP
jgi:hypothetical protein